jgi:hypothetical protein
LLYFAEGGGVGLIKDGSGRAADDAGRAGHVGGLLFAWVGRGVVRVGYRERVAPVNWGVWGCFVLRWFVVESIEMGAS